MLKYDSFYKYNTPFRPRILDFAFVDMLETGEQAPSSNDCGVWVATWMTNYRKRYSYTINVNDGTRMRVGLDLILRPHNLMLHNVIDSATRIYNNTFLASPLSQSHSATLLLPLIELLLTPSLPSLWPLNEHTEERREDRRELERSLEEARKQPSLVAVPQRPATAAATASAQRRPCSPPIRLLFGQASASVFWPTLVRAA
ncbi:Ulp1 protease family, carboxy-terminal domain protein [Arachis hypogaea]|nr:Ulp1 protease family, carboxy-terminal domain protein [Arachis hypogaea]